MNWLHLLGYSQLTYKYPVRPRKGEQIRFWDNRVTHIGRDRYALDIIVPDPRLKPLPIRAACTGKIIELVQHNTIFGAEKEHERFLNFVKVAVLQNGQLTSEIYVIAHIAANSCHFHIGDIVTADSVIATTGINGRMTDVRHTHFVVGKLSTKYPGGYESVSIRWNKNQKDASQ